MSKQSRHEFTESTKRTVAERAAYICSNPACRKPTVGPHSDPNKSLKTGEAAHVYAASPLGPRFDPDQRVEDRKSINNAIWLCGDCSTLIDKDAASFPAQSIFDWKEKHENWIKNGGIIPTLPELSITSLKGRSIPDTPGQITVEDFKTPEHVMMLKNVADVEIRMIEARIQLPESIIQNFGRREPIGVVFSWKPIRMPFMATIRGGGTITRNGLPGPTNIYSLEIDRLPASHFIEIGFTTSKNLPKELPKEAVQPSDRSPSHTINDSLKLRNFIDGYFQFEYRGATLKKRFFAPIQVDEEKRRFSGSCPLCEIGAA